MTRVANGSGRKKTSQPRLPDGVPRSGPERPLFFVIVYNNLVRHRKLMMLSQLLAITENEAIGLLVRLWCECGERAKDGDLSRYTSPQIAAACGWPLKHAGRLVDALAESGFLDRNKHGHLRVHDWDTYTGRAVLNRQANRERVARFRKRHKAQDRNGAVRVTPPLRNGHVRPKTRQDKTRVDKEETRTREEPTTSRPSFFHTLSSPSPEPSQGKDQSEDVTQNHDRAASFLPLPTLYRAATGLQPDPGAVAYLTKLADKYGTQIVRETLREEGPQIAAADRPLGYLGGILENQRREGHRQVGMVPPEPAPPPRPPEKLVECVACRRKGIETLVSVPIEDPGIGILCQRCAAPPPPPRDPHRGEPHAGSAMMPGPLAGTIARTLEAIIDAAERRQALPPDGGGKGDSA